MARGYSLSIGLSPPAPAALPTRHERGSAERDAAAYADLFRSNGYEAGLFLGAAVSRWAILARLHEIARGTVPGDVVALTFSGAGGSRWQRDVLEHFWQCFDGPLTHADLRRTWSAFSSGVRILVIDDCCYSGSSPERSIAMPHALRVVRPSSNTWGDARISTNVAVALAGENMAATVLCLSACTGPASWDGCTGGMFTEALLRTWNRGGFRGSYNTFCKRIRQALRGWQTPELVTAGPHARQFEMQRPFTIDQLPTEVSAWPGDGSSMKSFYGTPMMRVGNAR